MSRLVPNSTHRPRTLAALATLAVLTAGALLAAPTAASAAPAAAYATAPVYYNSSDLATDRGIRSVYRRIVNAAALVCPSEDSLNLEEAAASKECQQQAIAGAVAKVGSARLAAVYARTLARHG
jgi:UrcA family protein